MVIVSRRRGLVRHALMQVSLRRWLACAFPAPCAPIPKQHFSLHRNGTRKASEILLDVSNLMSKEGRLTPGERPEWELRRLPHVRGQHGSLDAFDHHMKRNGKCGTEKKNQLVIW